MASGAAAEIAGSGGLGLRSPARLPAARNTRDGSGGNAGDAKRTRAQNRHAERREARAPIARCAPRLANVAVASCRRDDLSRVRLVGAPQPLSLGAAATEMSPRGAHASRKRKGLFEGRRRRPRPSGRAVGLFDIVRLKRRHARLAAPRYPDGASASSGGRRVEPLHRWQAIRDGGPDRGRLLFFSCYLQEPDSKPLGAGPD